MKTLTLVLVLVLAVSNQVIAGTPESFCNTVKGIATTVTQQKLAGSSLIEQYRLIDMQGQFTGSDGARALGGLARHITDLVYKGYSPEEIQSTCLKEMSAGAPK